MNTVHVWHRDLVLSNTMLTGFGKLFCFYISWDDFNNVVESPGNIERALIFVMLEGAAA